MVLFLGRDEGRGVIEEGGVVIVGETLRMKVSAQEGCLEVSRTGLGGGGGGGGADDEGYDDVKHAFRRGVEVKDLRMLLDRPKSRHPAAP